MKRQVQTGRKYLLNIYLLNIVFKIYKALLQINNKKKTDLNNEQNRCFTKEDINGN